MGSKGVDPQYARGWFYNQTRWDHGSDHVELSSSLGLVHNYVRLSIGNDGGGPDHLNV